MAIESRAAEFFHAFLPTRNILIEFIFMIPIVRQRRMNLPRSDR